MLLESAELEFAERFSRFIYANPFLTDELKTRRDDVLAVHLDLRAEEAARPPLESGEHSKLNLIVRRSEALLERLKSRLRSGTVDSNDRDISLYIDLVVGSLYLRTFENRVPLLEAGDGTGRVRSYRVFAQWCRDWTDVPVALVPIFNDPAHLFAIYFQLRRAIELMHSLIQGNSRPITLLRASLWNSIFPHKLRLYGSLLYNRMHEVTTLILGPSGTGKELVATAIGLSRFVPFDAKRERFTEAFGGAFYPINLSAMPRDLIESEMFGHCAGSFTGATKDRVGWFEKCALGHTVFLDEIAELDAWVQVKLLRVLQNREFYRVGETEPRRFHGRVIAATNRDFGQEIAAGRFRQDLFYRLCSDVVRTPSLREQLDDCPSDLPFLVKLVAARCLGSMAEPEQIEWLTNLTVEKILASPELGTTYSWPGNFRELEQCVRNVMVRGEYHPAIFAQGTSAVASAATSGTSNPALDAFLRRVRAGEVTFDELLENYCSLIFSRSSSLNDAAKRLGKHRATVESRIVQELVAAFRQG